MFQPTALKNESLLDYTLTESDYVRNYIIKNKKRPNLRILQNRYVMYARKFPLFVREMQ